MELNWEKWEFTGKDFCDSLFAASEIEITNLPNGTPVWRRVGQTTYFPLTQEQMDTINVYYQKKAQPK